MRPLFVRLGRGQTVLAAAGVTFLFLLSTGIVVYRSISARLDRQELQALQKRLSESAQIVAHAVLGEHLSLSKNDKWDELAKSFAVLGRVTFIAPDGKVLGDSRVESGEIAHMENHKERPEVVVALGGHPGFSVRPSTTVGGTLVYVALPVPSAEGIWVLRLSENAPKHAGLVAYWLAWAGGLAWVLSVATAFLLVKETPEPEKPDPTDVALQKSLAELRTDRDLMGRILETMREGVLVLNARNRIVLCNQALREMLFLSGDVVGRPLIEIIRSADLTALADKTRTLLGKNESEFDLGGVRPRRLSVQAIPLVGETGGVLLVVVDVTEMRRLETLRRDFVANVSHELKTPVTAVRSAAETLREIALKDPEHALSFVDMIERNAQRLQNLVEDLLELSRIESRAVQLSLEPVPVASATEAVLSLFNERAVKKNVRLITQVPATVAAVADRRALEQILTNLVDNAVKYCPPQTNITIAAAANATSARGHEVRISVSDEGTGIEPKHLPRLFERFYRVDAGRAREVGGTGLGLSIVKHLTEAMGGNVSVESELGRGTKFTVTLPNAAVAPAPLAPTVVQTV